MTKTNALVMCLAALPVVAVIASCGPGPDGACVISQANICFGSGLVETDSATPCPDTYYCTDGISKSTCEDDYDAGILSKFYNGVTFHPNQTCGEVDCGPNQLCPRDRD